MPPAETGAEFPPCPCRSVSRADRSLRHRRSRSRTIIVAIEQALDRAVEAALGQTRHHEHVVAQRRERFIKCSQYMSVCDHRYRLYLSSLLLLFSILFLLPVLNHHESASNVILRLFLGRISENLSRLDRTRPACRGRGRQCDPKCVRFAAYCGSQLQSCTWRF